MKKDWTRIDLGKVVTLQRGYDLTRRERRPGMVPVVTSTGITDTHAVARERGPGVITGRYGTIGEVFFVKEDYWPHNTTLFVKNFHGNDPSFIAYLLRTIDFQTHSGKTGVPGVNRNDLHEVTVFIPPTVEEQRAIAQALNDIDALLGGQDRLLAKKRDLKQAAMQQLLTGQTRLPGFHGEWQVNRIGEFANCTAGGTPSTLVPSYWGGPIRWMNSGELNLKRVEDVVGRITEAGLRNSSTKMIPARCVLVGLAGQGKTRGTVAMNLVELCTNQSIAAIFPSSAAASEYLYYNLDNRYDELRDLSSGDGGRGGLNLTLINSLPILLPPISEQNAIAKVLTDMDAEIAALEERREKTRALKQAMMQELLTGKTRLI